MDDIASIIAKKVNENKSSKIDPSMDKFNELKKAAKKSTIKKLMEALKADDVDAFEMAFDEFNGINNDTDDVELIESNEMEID